jgi:hypothetical protein
MTLTIESRLYLFVIALIFAGFAFWAIGATGEEILAAESVYAIGALGIVFIHWLRQRLSR